MTSLLSDARRLDRRYFFELHPEWWSTGLCCVAWAVVLVHSWRGAGHKAHDATTFVPELANWMLMAAAMMLPLVLGAVRVTAFHSMWARRHRSIAGFLAGYFAIWLGAGLVTAGLRQLPWTRAYAAAAVGFAAAALWQTSTAHARAVAACHRRRPLAPFGWKADFDCLRYGGTIGISCVRSCLPLMLACAFSGHALIAIAGGMAVSGVERWSFWPRPRMVLAGTLGIAAYFASLAFLHPGLVLGQAPVYEVLGTTKSPFHLEKGATHLSLEIHAPTNPVLSRAETHKRLFLDVDGIRSQAWSAPYDVYLNLPPSDRPEQHPELRAGTLPMFGLVEANRSGGSDSGKGLFEQLDVTALFARLSAAPGWDGKNLRMSFVPRNPQAAGKIEIARVSLQVFQMDQLDEQAHTVRGFVTILACKGGLSIFQDEIAAIARANALAKCDLGSEVLVLQKLDLGRLCSNDPVCAQHSPQNTHEERYLMGAACHGCLHIAETLCERFNQYLDRSLVVANVASAGPEFFRDADL